MPINPKLAFIVDALPAIGGSEKVLMAAMELFPNAPVYSLIYNPLPFINTPIAQKQVYTSYLDRLPLAQTHYRLFLPLMTHAIEQFNLDEYDIVVSFSYAVAHGILTKPGQIHLSYTYTPMRFAWRDYAVPGVKKPGDKIVSYLFRSFRKWDLKAVTRVRHLASVSKWIKDFVQRTYLRDSTVIYPPVDVERFTPHEQRESYYITVTRLVAHKRVDLIIDAFNRLKLPLLVVGEGPDRSRLERSARSNIHFLGFQPNQILPTLLGRARGYLSASEEDFGISLIEAQASGCPVIAYGRGGSLETILDGQTGLFFKEQTSTQLEEVVTQFEANQKQFNPRIIAENVQCFNKGRFLDEFSVFVKGS